MKSTLFRLLVVVMAPVSLVAATLTVSKPEDVGLSGERLARIRTLMQSHVAAKDISGAVTLVARHGKAVHFEAIGLADIEANKPMQTGTLFRMASMTKPVTAVSILMLLEEGKLLLSDPVSKYVPEFKNAKVAVWRAPNDPAGAGTRLVPTRDLTIKDLLTHTSGLADGDSGAAAEYVRRANLPPGGSLAERVKRIGALPLNFAPGSQ